MHVKKSHKATGPKKTKKKRNYNNSARAAKSAKTEKTIIESLITLLVERRGGDVGMEEVARLAGITPRTVFRFFKDKQTLHQAMNTYLLSYLRSSDEQMRHLHFVGFAKNVFRLFDKYESLTLAYVFSPFGQETRALLRKKLNQAMMAKIIKEKNLKVTTERQKRLAFVTALVNAKIWADLKIDFDYSGEDMADSVEWALNTLLEKI